MSDNNFETALWLVAGGAAGLAAGRWIVAPRLSNASSSTAKVPTTTKPRALAIGPSGSSIPLDPYADAPRTGPSGMMQPIDPYAEPAATAPASSAPSIATPTLSTSVISVPVLDGPITKPSEIVTAPPLVSVIPSASSALVTRPSQVDVRAVPAPSEHTPARPSVLTTSGLFATTARVRRFDRVFEKYRGSLPIEYVRALVERESNGLPTVRTGSAIGLMQIVPVVLGDYNKRHGTSYRSEHLTDPATNVAIGCELLRLIVDSYRAHHPRIRTLQPDWTNLQFVGLVTFGWNAGHSEAGGVGLVASYLEKLGAVDIDIDQVSAHAGLAGASKHLSNAAKVAWCKSVVSLYQRERALQRAALV